MKLTIIAVLFTVFGLLHAEIIEFKGSVFFDANGNGTMDAGERGIAGAEVSDGVSVTLCDDKGAFRICRDIPSKKQPFTLFVSIPSGYFSVSGDAWFRSIEPGQKTESIDFPLQKSEKSQEKFSFIHISDTHLQSSKSDKQNRSFIYKYTPGTKTWDMFFGKFIPDILKEEKDAAFIIDTGDMGIRETSSDPVADGKLFRKRLDTLPLPFFFVPGNHDGTETASIAPLYYSFNYGKFHFVCLSRYPVTPAEMEQELEWLKKDLACYPPETPILIFTHMHWGTEKYSDKQDALFKILESRNVNALFFGHCHSLITAKHKNVLQISTPSFNYGGGWAQEYAGYPPSYRLVKIDGENMTVNAIKNVEKPDDKLWILCPKDKMIVEGAMYPYFNATSKWDGKVHALFLGPDFNKVKSVTCRIDDAVPLKMRGNSMTQGQWISLEDMRKNLSPGRHDLTVVAEMVDGSRIEKKIEIFTHEKYMPPAENIIKNPSFEENPVLTPTTIMSWDSSEKCSGARSIKMVFTAPWEKVSVGGDIPVDPDKLYNLSFMVKGENVQEVRIFQGFSDAHIVRLPAGTYGWTKINSQFRIKPGIRQIGLIFVNVSTGRPVTIWVDDIVLREVK